MARTQSRATPVAELSEVLTTLRGGPRHRLALAHARSALWIADASAGLDDISIHRTSLCRLARDLHESARSRVDDRSGRLAFDASSRKVERVRHEAGIWAFDTDSLAEGRRLATRNSTRLSNRSPSQCSMSRHHSTIEWSTNTPCCRRCRTPRLRLTTGLESTPIPRRKIIIPARAQMGDSRQARSLQHQRSHAVSRLERFVRLVEAFLRARRKYVRETGRKAVDSLSRSGTKGLAVVPYPLAWRSRRAIESISHG